MLPIQNVNTFQPFKALGDPLRLSILRLLISAPGTLSQLGQSLGAHPAKIRHHLKQLEEFGLVELTETRVVRGYVEKYYRATARAFYITLTIMPEHPGREMIIAMGSDDPALDLLAHNFHDSDLYPDVLAIPVGSLDGLIALRQGICQVAGCHLLDIETGDYNLTYIKHIFPDRSMLLLTLAHRCQGLLVQQGNPLGIHGLRDLVQQDVCFINRKKGSGTRLWFDYELKKLGISPTQVRGYDQETNTHRLVGQAIVQHQANVGLGLQDVAHQLELGFIPLYEERYDLVMHADAAQTRAMRTLIEYIQGNDYRHSLETLIGYDTAHTGETTIS